MPTSKPITTRIHPDGASWTPFESAVPPTPGEQAAGAAEWERRGLLGRLVRVN
jgi:hypothetical protein